MKTDLGLLRVRTHCIVIFALVLFLVVSSGCASKPTRAQRTSYPYPSPPVVGADEILRRDAVTIRTRELVRAGQAPRKARRVAENENPPAPSSTDTAQSAEYFRWKQRQAVQNKFEGELDKMNRDP